VSKIIYIHPGFPKTASTSIQRNFFSKNQTINNLGKKYSVNDVDEDLEKVFIRIISQKEINEDDYLENKKIINSIIYLPNKINLISYEAITQLNFDISAEKIFKRIKKLFHECGYEIKIFVMIRSQLTMIPSHFANTGKAYVKRGTLRWKSFKNFINDLENINDIEDTRLLAAYDRYKYFNLLKTLIKIFSDQNIKFFLYEDLKENPKKFFDELIKFLNIETPYLNLELDQLNVTRKKEDEFKRIDKNYFRNLKFVSKILKNLKSSHKEYCRKFLVNFL
jgi:hypothetical protein